MPSQCRAPAWRGFTLAELLVAVGIISLLVALLFPALSKSRRQAEQVACLAQLRQVGAAFIAYAHDNRGWLPAPATAWGVYPEDWVHWQPTRDVRDNALFRYLGDANVLKCPAGVPPRTENLLFGGTPFPVYPFSYSVNILLIGPHPPHSPPPRWRGLWKFNQIINPSQKVLALEEDPGGIDDGACNPRGAPSPARRATSLSLRHDRPVESTEPPTAPTGYIPYMAEPGRGNVVFADGHGEFFERRWMVDQFVVPAQSDNHPPHTR